MKGQGKPPGAYLDLGKRIAIAIRVHRKCIKQGCGKWYSISNYRIASEDYLCPKHREELHQEEAERILLERAINQPVEIY